MRRLLALLLGAVLLSSCSRPTGGEVFLPGPRNSHDFPLDVADTLAYYDFSFYTRVDKAGAKALGPREALLSLIHISEPTRR